MGGLYVLLAVATMGVTYGWQPDGRGGVEYLVQVSPAQLEQVRRTGQISSAIDPAVQGHVSRIIVSVGNSPLPRIVPPNMAAANQSGDHAVIAAPSIPVEIAASSTPSQTSTMMMKPDPQGAGMGLPGIAADRAKELAGNAMTGAQDLLRNTGNAAGDAARNLGNRATDAVANGARRTRDAAANAANNALTRGTNAVNRGASELFSGSQNARVAASGGREAARDNVWRHENESTDPRNIPRVNQTATGNQPPAFIGPPDPRNRSTNGGTNLTADRNTGHATAAANSREGNYGAGNYGAGNYGDGNFGNLPKGMSVPNRNDAVAGYDPSSPTINELRRNGSNTSATNRAPSRTGLPSTDQRDPRSLATRPNTASLGGNNGQYGYGQTEYGSSNRTTANGLERDPRGTLTRDPRSLAADNRLANTMGTGIGANDPRRSNGSYDPANYDAANYNVATNASTANNRNLQQNMAASRLPGAEPEVDPRLSKADVDRLPKGGYSFDEYGNPIDKYQRVLNHLGMPVSRQQAYELTIGRDKKSAAAQAMGLQNRAAPNNNVAMQSGQANGYPNVNAGFPNNGNLGYPNSNSGYQNTGLQNAGLQSTAYNNQNGSYRRDLGQTGTRNVGLSSRSDENSSTKGPTSRKTFAAQSFFNVLLLVSVAANIYLVGWMRRFYLRYREVVASKRVASTNVGSVSA